MVFEATCTIAASPETIWSILTDAAGYADWDSGVAVRGTIAEGQKIRLVTERAPDLAESLTDNGSSLKVSDLVPGEHMTWSGGVPFGLAKGVRTFTLEPAGEGLTRFTMREETSGMMLGAIAKRLPDAERTTFDRFANGLKARAEAG